MKAKRIGILDWWRRRPGPEFRDQDWWCTVPAK
jgi:hypothetical protein